MKLLFSLLLTINYITLNAEPDSKLQEETPLKVENLLTAKVYAKLFKERRAEQHFMTKQLLKSSYEKNYKLLQLAYEKIFEVINEQNSTLNKHNYQPAESGFPQDEQLQEALTLSLENCCLAAESLLHFPEISYRILRKAKAENWQTTLNWCIGFVNALPHIIDESSVKLMDLLQQEINVHLRANNYENPYYEKVANNEKLHVKKPKKKLKKGPQLNGARAEL